jgi:hypothetical protein
MALVLLSETLDGVALVLMNAAIEESCNAHVKRSGSAAENVNPEFAVIAVAHEGEEDNTPAAWRERLVAAWEGTLCRDLSTPPQSQSSFLVGRDDKGMVVKARPQLRNRE